MPDPTIYYIRHGETDWNAELRFQGQQDIPLNSKGQRQADENGQKLAKLLKNPDALQFIASPLGRARETMERLRTAMGLPIDDYTIEDRLIEVSYGDLEGTTQPEMKAQNRERYYFRKNNPWSFRPIDGESHEDVLKRVINWHDTLENDCVVAAHGAVGRVVRYYLLGLDENEAAKFPFPQDKIFVLRRGHEEIV